MSSNQRLLLAVALSVVFFVVYSAIFPPKPPQEIENNVTAAQTQSQPQRQDNAAQSQTRQPQSAQSAEPLRQSEASTLVNIDAAEFTMKIDTLGRIGSMVLKNEKYHDEDGAFAELIPPYGAKPLFIRFADETLNAKAAKVPYVASAQKIDLNKNEHAKLTLTQNLGDLIVTKKITVYRDGHYDLRVHLSQERRYFLYLGERPDIKSRQVMVVKGAMVYDAKKIVNIFEDGDVEGRSAFSGALLASAFDQYFATIFFDIDPKAVVTVERDRDDNPIVYLDATQDVTLKGYIGPKEYKKLKSIDPVLVNAIEYGWFTFAAAPLFKLLSFLHDIFGNWGWAIIALTIIIRILLYPLTYRGMLSMQKMKDLAPKIKEIQAKYKGDPQRMNAAVMEVYQKHGANPLGGCLPMLLQIPVFFAIYRVLLNAVELQGAPWALWITDLSRMDPTFILPILMGASMYYQQKMTPNNFTDPLQKKVFQFLPVIFTFFFITFPSGLVLYWFVNNLFSIAQQVIVNKKYEAFKAKKHQEHLAKKHKHEHDKD